MPKRIALHFFSTLRVMFQHSWNMKGSVIKPKIDCNCSMWKKRWIGVNDVIIPYFHLEIDGTFREMNKKHKNIKKEKKCFGGF